MKKQSQNMWLLFFMQNPFSPKLSGFLRSLLRHCLPDITIPRSHPQILRTGALQRRFRGLYVLQILIGHLVQTEL